MPFCPLWGFNCLWKLSFVLGKRKKRRVGGSARGREREKEGQRVKQKERILDHMPFHLIQPTAIHWNRWGWRGMPTKYAKGQNIRKEELTPGFPCGNWNIRSHPSLQVTLMDGVPQHHGKYCQGRGANPGWGRFLGKTREYLKKWVGIPLWELKSNWCFIWKQVQNADVCCYSFHWTCTRIQHKKTRGKV